MDRNQEKLNEYIGGMKNYTTLMNIIINNRSKDWYSEIGKYINNNLDISKIESLSFFNDIIKEQTFCERIKNKISKRYDINSRIAIHFLTSTLDDVALRNMFGEPLLHDEFGEGFDGEYDDETDEYGEPEIKESYASHFATFGGVDMHIGYDHRGTSIEVNGRYEMHNDDAYAEKIFNALKELVDLYKSKN
jgi:hypothetical protein